MKDKQYFVDEVYGALVIISLFVKDASYILDCTNGIVLRDGLGMALAGGINNVAKRLVADREARSAANAEPTT